MNRLGRSRGWPKTLHNWLDRHAEGMAPHLLLQLEKAGEDVSYILRQTGKSRRKIVDMTPSAPKTVELDGKMFVERRGEWKQIGVCRQQLAHISDVIMKLTHAIKDKDSKEMYLKGELYYRGKTVEFIDKAHRIVNATRAWMSRQITDCDLGLPIIQPYRSSTLLYSLALKFYGEPEFVKGNLANWVKRLSNPRCRRDASPVESPDSSP